MKNYSKKLSLQWRLTLVTALLVTITCILMYFFISQSAVTGMDHLQNYIVQINETGSSPITFNVDPTILFPDLTEQVTTTKHLFQIRSLIATILIILLSSACTYFVSRRALKPLHSLSTKIEKIQAQNLSEPLEVPDSNDEISKLTLSFNEMLSRLTPLQHRNSFLPVQHMNFAHPWRSCRQIWKFLPEKRSHPPMNIWNSFL